MNTLEMLGNNWLENLDESLSHIEIPQAADGSVQFRVDEYPEGGFRLFHVTLESGRISVSVGRCKSPDVSLKWKFADFVLAWQGELSLEEAYMSGRLKLEGDRVLIIDGWRPLRESHELRTALQDLKNITTTPA